MPGIFRSLLREYGYERAPLALPGRALLRVDGKATYLKPLGMRLLAAAASVLVMRQFLSTCTAQISHQPAAERPSLEGILYPNNADAQSRTPTVALSQCMRHEKLGQ